jgi:hypothetical protein
MANRGNNVISNLVREESVLESEKPLVYQEQAVMSISSLCKDLK